MSREALQESLSAVMDNEADELELRRVLSALDDADTRATWSRYQIARAVMHKELLDPRLDIASAVSAALAGEEVPAKGSRGPWRTLGRLAVAASVTVAVLAGVRFYNQDDIAGAQLAQQSNQPGLAAPTVKGPAVLAGYTEGSEPTGPMANGVLQQGQPGWDQRLPGYLRQHAQQAALKGTESALPYARAASLETAK
ncbi:RNA polymerase subunit sigma [Pseudomonas gingeri NCPPB 3146 = LMG 5327]|uniref:RNA polymerase subunit sigma n=2 Tax=Pseudomonas gingeri TaxID=117681 RepID=A0A7Y7XYZ0_9PSED|nr:MULTISPECIES: RseA family anti-sigma factor [Pseudomonas]NVZ27459.1 RNA polymerase subunit sigma [Pseudomonas gingeri]NVZ64665.1 RNA polymerase subunit sigma [Pseudomonas gingeri]NVZ76845.1 RNA polymerase subunit sigma [Pseudomonas gingeri]NWA10649.1 RNA polymerase subunit sigma [Pseudomonas gingeri]NWC14913.1 RNA polymerase subunit sigma [Pseudomonas gingeri]